MCRHGGACLFRWFYRSRAGAYTGSEESQQPPAKLVVWWGTAKSGLKGLCYFCDGTMGSAQVDPFGDPEAPGS